MSVPDSLDGLPEPPAWMADALCAQTGPGNNWFHPAKGESPSIARDICARCPVAEGVCLAYGMDDPYGVYAGYTAKERRALRHGHTCADCETPLIYPRAKRCRACANSRRRRQHLEHNLTRERTRAATKQGAR